jgi:hypothetical protein
VRFYLVNPYELPVIKFKGMPKYDFARKMNELYPIKLKTSTIDRIVALNPSLFTKEKTKVVCETMFESLRELFLLGNVVSFGQFFSYHKLIFYYLFSPKSSRPNGISPAVKLFGDNRNPKNSKYCVDYLLKRAKRKLAPDPFKEDISTYERSVEYPAWLLEEIEACRD